MTNDDTVCTLILTIIKSPTVFDKLVTKVKDEPNSRSGMSNDTGLCFSNITMSSVVVGRFVVVVVGTGCGLKANPGSLF